MTKSERQKEMRNASSPFEHSGFIRHSSFYLLVSIRVSGGPTK